MKYNIVIWTYSGAEVVSKFECFTQTQWEAIGVFDTLTRGIRGYYRAWCIDLEDDKELRYSSVLLDSVGG